MSRCKKTNVLAFVQDNHSSLCSHLELCLASYALLVQFGKMETLYMLDSARRNSLEWNELVHYGNYPAIRNKYQFYYLHPKSLTRFHIEIQLHGWSKLENIKKILAIQ